MDIEGKELLGTLGVIFIALILVGILLSSPIAYLFAVIDFIALLVAGIYFNAKGSMRIKDIWKF